MIGKKVVKLLFIFSFLTLMIYFSYTTLVQKDEIILNEQEDSLEKYNSNIIQNVEYTTKDADGNEYFIKASKGEIDFSNSNMIFLTEVNSLIKLVNSEEVTIFSDYGKYNSDNFDTIFSKNVIINYLDNNITGDYLDFSLEKNFMTISNNVIYKNLNEILKADVMEMDLKTKDTKIFMYEKEKKVNIKSLD